MDKYNIKEAAKFLNLSEKTLYRHIKQGLLLSETVREKGRNKKLFDRKNLEDFKNSYSQIETGVKSDRERLTETENERERLRETENNADIKGLVKEAITELQGQLMKPMEEQALYRLGILENEVKHLHAEKELLRQENEDLKNSIKALPGPSELNKRDEVILQLQEEMDILPGRPAEIKEILLQNADNLKALQKELELQEARIKTEYEERLKKSMEQAEEEKQTIADRWKKELELAKRSWWKFW